MAKSKSSVIGRLSYVEPSRRVAFIRAVLVALDRQMGVTQLASITQPMSWFCAQYAAEFDLQVVEEPFMAAFLRALTPLFKVRGNIEASFSPDALRAAIATKPAVTREIDPEYLTQEEQADLVASQMALRGNKTQLRGVLTTLDGLMMRPNALLNAERLEQAWKDVEELAKASRAEIAKSRRAS